MCGRNIDRMTTFNINALPERIERYLDAAEQVKSSEDADVIHDFRIASRTVLALEPLLHTTGKTRHWRAQIQHWLKALNHLRDLQVMRERLGEHPALAGKLEKGIVKELAAWQAIRHTIADKAFRKRLNHSVERFCQRCSAHPGYFAATTLLLWWDTLETVQTRFDAIRADKPATLHRLRVAFKSLRYLANTLRNIGVIAEDATAGLKHWHNLLGDIQDRQVAEAWLQHKKAHTALSAQQATESASLQTQFMQEQAQFQAMLIQLDTAITASLRDLLEPRPTNCG